MTDCDKCKEYDKEKNYCPVFCNVINDTLTDKAIEELEKIKAEIEEYGSIWVQYSIKGHTDKDIDDIVDNVLKQAKQSFIRRLDKHISELKGENNAK